MSEKAVVSPIPLLTCSWLLYALLLAVTWHSRALGTLCPLYNDTQNMLNATKV